MCENYIEHAEQNFQVHLTFDITKIDEI